MVLLRQSQRVADVLRPANLVKTLLFGAGLQLGNALLHRFKAEVGRRQIRSGEEHR